MDFVEKTMETAGSLWSKIKTWEEDKKYSSQEELHADLKKLVSLARAEGNLYLALEGYIELNDRENVRKVSQECLNGDWLEDARKGFFFLRDQKGLLEVIKTAECESDESEILRLAPRDYLGIELGDRDIEKEFKSWAAEHGFEDAYALKSPDTINLAHHLASKYDLGVGIARGGLFSTYAFEKFGLETKIVDSHKRGKGTTFKWHSEVSREDLEGKNLVVFDKDVVSGKTSKRVLREIKSSNPCKIDLVLINDPIGKEGEVGSIAHNIPNGYDTVYSPADFGYGDLDKAVERFSKASI